MVTTLYSKIPILNLGQDQRVEVLMEIGTDVVEEYDQHHEIDVKEETTTNVMRISGEKGKRKVCPQ